MTYVVLTDISINWLEKLLEEKKKHIKFDLYLTLQKSHSKIRVFWVWLLSPIIMNSRLIHAVDFSSSLFLLLNNKPFCNELSYSPVEAYFYVYFLQIVNEEAINTYKKVVVKTKFFIFLGWITRSSIVGSYDKCVFNFTRNF